MWDKSKTTWAVGIAQLTHHSPRWGHWQKSLDLRSRDFCPHLEPRGEFKGLRPVLEGFVVTMHEGAWKQEVKSRGRYWSGRKGQSYALGLGYRRWKSRRPWGAPHGVNTWLEHYYPGLLLLLPRDLTYCSHKQRVLMHRHQGWNVRHGLCHIYMRYLYIYELFIVFVCFVVCSLL